ncbi:GLUG motif-containing protein [Natronobeatus ordinarius]|uniref:GLUG motif-containing protein n=1 Tax=Natronobeatus ordinarius TaxID=2963433 RepID=UPI0020CFC77F|nr:GLUG motif-containing protein [Natronobeatus ordinarius]
MATGGVAAETDAPDCSEVDLDQNSEGYYEVGTLEQLQCVGDDADGPGLDADYVLTNDIDASATAGWNDGAGFEPIGASTLGSVGESTDEGFVGTFDGDGHTISGLAIDRPDDENVGLFGLVGTGATVTDLTLEDADVTGGEHVGGLAGMSAGYVEDATVTGSVVATGHDTGADYGTQVGGIVGRLDGTGTVTASVANATVTAESGQRAGGLVGTVTGEEGTVFASGAEGDVTGVETVGGLVGVNNGEISASYATGAVTGEENVGGLVGENFDQRDPVITASYATGVVDGTGTVGGLVATDESAEPIVDSYWDETASGITYSDGGTGLETWQMTGTDAEEHMALLSHPQWFLPEGDDYPILFWEAADLPAYQAPDCSDVEFEANDDGYYEVGTLEQLQCVGDDEEGPGLDADYVLTNDIDASATSAWNDGAGFEPIGFRGEPGSGEDPELFTGTFDGDGHVISDLTVNQPDGFSVGGLFEYTEGNITRVGLENVSVTAEAAAGGFVGTNEGTITDSYVTGELVAEQDVGGFGFETSGQDAVFERSFAAVDIETDGLVNGGFLAGHSSGTVSDVYAVGEIDLPDDFGDDDEDYAGGLIGWHSGGTVENAYWDVAATGVDEGIGDDDDEGVTGLHTPAMVGVTATYELEFDFEDEWAVEHDDTLSYPYPAATEPKAPPTPETIGAPVCADVEYTERDRSRDFGYEVLLEVGTPIELQCIGHEDSSASYDDDYLLTNDIDLADTAHWNDGEGFDPIGVRAEPGEDDQSFTGTFDGDGHTISNLTIDRTGQFNALFVAANGTISDVGLEQVAIAGGSSNTAGLVGVLEEGGAVHGVSASGSVEANRQVGGLVAVMYPDTEVRDSSSTVDVTAHNNWAGGVAAGMLESSSDDEVTIENTYAAGTISGNESGGVVGFLDIDTEYTNVYWDVNTTGQDHAVGDVGGDNEGPTTPEGATGLETWQLTGADAEEHTELLSEPRWFLPEGDDYPILFWEAADLPAYQAPDCSEVDFVQNDDGYYEVGTLEQLQCVGDDEEGPGLDANYVLIDDIDASDATAWHDAKGFDPIGDEDEGVAFTGTFDGDGHVISNIVMNRPEHGYGNYLGGLFEYTGNDGTITGVGLEDVDITADTNVGGFVGRHEGTITDSYVTGTITAQGSMGGFAMQTMGDGTIERSAAVVDLTGDQWAIGGFIGAHDASRGALNDVYAAGEITLPSDYGDSDSYYAGGVAGGATASPDIENAYWDVDATGLDDGIGERDDQGVTGLHTPDMVGVSATQAMDLDFEDDWAVEHGDSLSYPYPAMVGLEAPPTPDSLELACHAIEYAEASDGFLEIRTPMELQCLGHENASGSLEDDYVLMNDIDLADTAHWNDGEGFEPIGEDRTGDNWFTGTFDGNGHVISNLTIDRSERHQGLFATINGTVTAVGLEQVDITGTRFNAPLADALKEDATVEWVSVSGSVEAEQESSGLVARMFEGSELRDSYTTATVTVSSDGGGIVSGVVDATIENTYAAGPVSGNESGGVADFTPDGNQVEFIDVYWDVNATGQDDAVGNDGFDGDSNTPEGTTGLETTAMVGTAAEEHMNVSFGAFWATQTDPDDYPALFWEVGMPHPTSLDCAEIDFEQTDEGAYEVGTLDQLQCIGDDEDGPGLDAHYVLTNDIDAARSPYMNDHTAFAPIGDEDAPFTGSFDGNGYEITELTIDDPDGDGPTGLFAVFDDGRAGHEIHNVSLLDVDVWSNPDAEDNEHTGALVGVVEEGSISNVTVTGNVTGGDNTGLVAGEVDGSITNVTATGNVTGDRNTGVVAGEVDGDFRHVSAAGTASGGTQTGGAVGVLRNTDAKAVSADVDVTGDRWVGGAVGRVFSGEATQLTATGTVTGIDEVGGLVGAVASSGTVTDSVSTGDVSGDSEVGGFAGRVHGGEVTDSVATADVTATGNRVGGFAGRMFGGSVNNSYAQGAVSGGGTGGFVGYFTSGEITGVYATGAVEDGGGLVGSRNPQTSPEMTNGYWDVDATGQDEGIGSGELEGMTGLETDQFVDVAPAVFAPLEYEEAWTLVDDDYPALAWEDRAVPATAEEPITIDESGTYSLHADLEGPGTILEITASDVAFDGDNHALEVADAGGVPAVVIDDGSESNVTVAALTVEHDASSAALEVGDVTGATVESLTANATVGEPVTLSFEGENVVVEATDTPAEAPTDNTVETYSAERYVEVTVSGAGELRDLELSYDPDVLPEDAAEETLALWTHDGEEWSPVADSSVDADRRVVIGNVTDGSTVGAFATPPIADLEIGDFADQFPDGEAGDDYGTVEIPIEETAGEGSIDLAVTLEIVGDETGTVFTETNDTLELAGEGATLEFDVGEIDEADTYTATVTADATNAEPTTRSETFETLEPATAALSDLEIAESGETATITEGDEANVSVDVTNAGDVAGSFTIELELGDAFEANATTDELAADETETVGFENVTGDLEAEEYAVSVADAAGDDELTGTLTVEAPAEFLVSIEETNEPVDPGAVLTVTANVTNAGDQPGTQTVGLLDFEGTERDATDVTLEGGESNESVVLEWETEWNDGDTAEVTVETADDAATTEVTVYETILEIEDFADQFPDGEPGHDYATVTITVDETMDQVIDGFEITLEVAGVTEGVVFEETIDDETIWGAHNEFTFAVGQLNATDEYTATVTADAETVNETTRSVTFTVEEPPEPAQFEVSDLEPDAPTVAQGETLDVSASVTNVGEELDEQVVELRIDGSAVATQTVELAGDETEFVEFADVTTADLEPGSYEFGVFSDDSSQTGTLTVEEPPEPAVFDVSDLEPDALTVESGESFDVSATVTNIGEEAGEQPVELRVDGDVVATESVSLGSGETKSVAFTEIEPAGLEPGTYEFGVFSEDANQTGTLTVEATAPDEAVLEVGDFAAEFPDATAGHDYAPVEIPVEELAGVETEGLEVTLEIVGDETGEAFVETNDTLELTGEEATVEFEVGPILEADTYTATVTADAMNAEPTIRSEPFELVDPDGITDCRVIDDPGVYELAGNLTTDDEGRCLEVTASDVVLEGGHHVLSHETASGDRTAIAVDGGAEGLENVTVRELTVDGWETGVAFENVTGGGLEFVDVYGTPDADGDPTLGTVGIELRGTEGLEVSAVDVTDVRMGLSMIEANDTDVFDLVTVGTQIGVSGGLEFPGERDPEGTTGVGNTFEEVTAADSAGQGIYLHEATGTTMNRTVAIGESNGIMVVHGEALEVTATDAVGSSGLYVGGVSDATLEDVSAEATDEFGNGLTLELVEDVTVSDADVYGGLTGIHLVDVTGLHLEDATMTGGSLGFNVYRSDGAVENATLTDVTYAAVVFNDEADVRFEDVVIDGDVVSAEGEEVTFLPTTAPADGPDGVVSLDRYVAVEPLEADGWLDLEVHYTEAELGSLDEETLSLWAHDGEAWHEIEESTVDTDRRVVTATLVEDVTVGLFAAGVPGEAVLEVGDFAAEFPDATAGHDYGTVVIPVEELAGVETEGLEVALEIAGDDEGVVFDETVDDRELEGDGEGFGFDVGVIDAPDTYTATVTADADNAEAETRTVPFVVLEDEQDLADYVNDDGVVDTDGLRAAIDDWRGGVIDTDLLRDVIDAWRSGEPVGSEPTLADYVDDDGVVDTDGLRRAIDDWRGGEIDTDLLWDVIDAWRSGEPAV